MDQHIQTVYVLSEFETQSYCTHRIFMATTEEQCTKLTALFAVQLVNQLKLEDTERHLDWEKRSIKEEDWAYAFSSCTREWIPDPSGEWGKGKYEYFELPVVVEKLKEYIKVEKLDTISIVSEINGD